MHHRWVKISILSNTSVNDQIPTKLMTFQSAPAVLAIWATVILPTINFYFYIIQRTDTFCDQSHLNLWPLNSNQFWKKSRCSWDTTFMRQTEVTVTLAFDHQNVICSSSCTSTCLRHKNEQTVDILILIHDIHHILFTERKIPPFSWPYYKSLKNWLLMNTLITLRL